MKTKAAWLAACVAAGVAAGCAGPGAPQLARMEDVAGGRWHWVGAVSSAGAVAPADASRYWVEFSAQGGVLVMADCNAGVGKLTHTALAIGTIGLTGRLCDPGSQDARFAAGLSNVRSGELDGDLLRLAAEGEELVLLRDAGARLVDYACIGGASHAVVFGAGRAYLRKNGRFRRLEAQKSASGAHYADSQTLLLTKGDEAFVENRNGARVGPCLAKSAARP